MPKQNMQVSKFTVLLLLLTTFSFSQIKGYENYPTGAQDPTEEELKWMKKNVQKTSQVHLNKIALERIAKKLDNINKRRQNKGFAPLSREQLTQMKENAAFIGKEISGRKGQKFIQSILPQSTGETLPNAEPESQFDIPESELNTILPNSVDNSQLPGFPPIRNQENGSCCPFSVTYYQLTHEVSLVKGWDNKNENNSTKFSPQWTYTLANGIDGGGVGWGDAYRILVTHGACTWEEEPVTSEFNAWTTDSAAWRNAINFRIESVGQVENFKQADGIETMKKILTNGHVLIFGGFIHSFRMGYIDDDLSTSDDDAVVGERITMYSEEVYNSSTGTWEPAGYHSMTFVGFNDDIWIDINRNGLVEPSEKGAFKFANSWGPGWGNNGYLWIAYDALFENTQVPNWPAPVHRFPTLTCVYWLTPRADYTPKLVGKVTLNHASRGEMRLALGTSGIGESSPLDIWNTFLENKGGNFAFDGTTTARDATFYFDFTDLLPAEPEMLNYYFIANDNSTGNPLTIKNFSLINEYTEGVELVSNETPVSVDNEEQHINIAYEFSSTNQSPIASFSVTNVENNTYTFDATASVDPDGYIAEYRWDFGDGIQSSGPVVSHTYTVNGFHNATLTVIDQWYKRAYAEKLIAIGAGLDTMVVSGYAVDQTNGSTIPDAAITFTGSNAISISTRSRSDGFFSFTVPSETGELKGKGSNFISITPVSISAAQTTPVVLELSPIVYMSDLQWEPNPSCGWGTLSKDLSCERLPMYIDGTHYAKGIGTHAYSNIVYDLTKLTESYDYFYSWTGIDDARNDPACGSIQFSILTNGTTTYSGPVLYADSPAELILTNIQGSSTLSLNVNTTGDNYYCDLADWGDACLVKTTSSSNLLAAPSELSLTDEFDQAVIKISNNTASTMEILSISSYNSVFVITAVLPISIAPGSSVNIPVTFTSGITGSHTGTITFFSSSGALLLRI